MLEGIKIECWDVEDSHGSIELGADKDEEEECQILHIEIPMLEGGKVVSFFLEDFEKAVALLKQ